MGEFLQELFKQHHLNQASVARALGQSSQNISDMFERGHIRDETLVQLSAAARVDFYAMVKAEEAKRRGEPSNVVSEGPLPAYGHQATHLISKPSSFKLIIELEHYPAESRIELLSFLERLSARRPGTQLGHEDRK